MSLNSNQLNPSLKLLKQSYFSCKQPTHTEETTKSCRRCMSHAARESQKRATSGHHATDAHLAASSKHS
jgi:hypothetical protein